MLLLHFFYLFIRPSLLATANYKLVKPTFNFNTSSYIAIPFLKRLHVS